MKALTAGIITALCVGLCGCSDATGEIDPEGHNGYDKMTCQDAKAFALDAQYSGIVSAERRQRIQQVTDEMVKASDEQIRQAAKALIDNYQAGNRAGVNTAIVSLVKACQL